MPVFMLFLLAILPPDFDDWRNFGGLSEVFSMIYNTLILRAVVFFGCAWIFMNLFRGEVVDRSLHYYFLSPIRREVLVVGKYLSGLVTAIVLFGLTTLLSLFMLYFPRFSAESTRYFFEGAGGKQALIYLGITTLAVIGYGAIFLIVGLFFRNPVIPALLIYGWEWINFLLPPLFKKVSVIHYLHSLMPVPMNDGPFAVMAEPTPAWLSVPSLLVFTLLVLALAGYHTRRMEISYVGD
jgi:ABC-type transport system involved in multi-copper enzyme maturation permease subunit